MARSRKVHTHSNFLFNSSLFTRFWNLDYPSLVFLVLNTCPVDIHIKLLEYSVFDSDISFCKVHSNGVDEDGFLGGQLKAIPPPEYSRL